MTACSATLMLLQNVTSATVMSGYGRVEVHVVGSDAGGDGQLEIRCFGDTLGG